MAQRSLEDSDKALWLTLAQSWVRLAEVRLAEDHVARPELSLVHSRDEEESATID